MCVSLFYAGAFVLKGIRFYSGIQFPHYIISSSLCKEIIAQFLQMTFFFFFGGVTGGKFHCTLSTAMG